ncbi:MAG: response regulator [Selenomonadaceae bacterium]|nr:response regulator [Selenomonadaceae bacterium]
MTERELIKRIRDKYSYELTPFDDRNVTRVLADSGVMFFYYYPQLKLAVLPPRPEDTESGFSMIENMPDGYADPYVAADDRAKFLALYRSIELGDPTAQELIRLDDGSVWYRVSLNVIRRDDDGKAQVVLGIAEDLSEIMNEAAGRQRALIAANDDLKSVCNAANLASTANHKFLSSLSHDIRTPMNDIIGMVALAETYIGNPERLQDCLSKVSASSKQLLSLISEVLDISRIATGSFALDSAEFNLPDLIDDVLSDIHIRTDQHHQSLQAFLFNLTHENVIGDRQRLRQLFTSLLSNAVTNTKDGGCLSVSISESDTGCPKTGCFTFIVSAEDQDSHLDFAPNTAEQSPDNLHTDFGLAIVNDIVKLMSGSIKVEGSTCTITVHLALAEETDRLDSMTFAALAGQSVLVADSSNVSCRSALESLNSLGLSCDSASDGAEALDLIISRHLHQEDFFAVILSREMPNFNIVEAIRTIRQEVGSSLPIIISSTVDRPDIAAEVKAAGADGFLVKPFFRSRLIHLFGDLLNGQKPGAAPVSMLDAFQQEDFGGKRALLVEDNEINAEIAAEVLSMVGLTVEHARDGLRAFQMVQSAPEEYYDIVFMDIQMPIMDGYEATAAIRSLPLSYVKSLPIIAVTANAFAEDVQAARQVGMNEHIAKPLDFTRLHELLVKYLG